jgi:hypothetical protein
MSRSPRKFHRLLNPTGSALAWPLSTWTVTGGIHGMRIQTTAAAAPPAGRIAGSDTEVGVP